MAATIWPISVMRHVLEQLQARFPQLTFTAGATFAWSPATAEIVYGDPNHPHATWALLHETGHALLTHDTYNSDLELLLLETAAWQYASQIAASLAITIDDEHVQDCLDTYREWLHARSACPRCGSAGIQHQDEYHCFNCHGTWRVTTARFCRPYRTSISETGPSLALVSGQVHAH